MGIRRNDIEMKLAKYLKPYWLFTLLTPLSMVGEVLVDLSQPRLMAKIVDEGVVGGNMELIIHTGIIMMLLICFGGMCGVGSAAFSGMASQGFARDLRNDTFKKVMRLSFEQTDKFTTGSLVTRLTNDITQVQQFVDFALRMLVRDSILFVGGIIMMLSLDINFGLVLVCALPVEMVLIMILIKKATPIYSIVQKKLDKVNSVVQENVAGARVVKAFVREEHEAERFDKANVDLMQTNLKVQKIMSILNPLLMIVMNLSVIAIILIGGFQVEAGEMKVGQIMAALTYINQILMGIMMISMMFQSISRANASGKRICEVLYIEPVIKPGSYVSDNGKGGAVSFKNVSFKYPGTNGEPVIKNLSVDIKPGENFAVLGATGSGKSSLINLIPRFYDADEGEVLVDGVNVKEYDLDCLRKKIGMVLQKSELFSGTVYDNIAWGDKYASKTDIEKAAKIAQADEFVSLMPAGYDGYIAEKGASLSGGQKQRLSIARSILKKPEILIFDDSTSALDLGTESRLQRALDENLKDITVIKIAQRIASVMNCDRIAVLEHGSLCALGTHEELLKTSEVYRDIYNSQMKNSGEGDL